MGCLFCKYFFLVLSMKKIDITGQKFGRLTVLKESNTKSYRLKWVCVCECGNTIETSGDDLKSGHTKSCGCLSKEVVRGKVNLIGEVFGRLKVLRELRISKNIFYWFCLCECGNTKQVPSSSLFNGGTKSCGCLHKEAGAKNRTHGMGKRIEYRIWNLMIQRCHNMNNPSYKNYGARGIKVCDRWRVFENFYEDVGDRPSLLHSIDRFPNNDGNYEPSNFRWATKEEQDRNKSTNRWFELNGIKLIMADWAKRWGISPAAIVHRINKGNSFEEIFNHFELKQAS